MLGKTSSYPAQTARFFGTSKVKFQHKCLQDFAKQKHHKGWLWAEVLLRQYVYVHIIHEIIYHSYIINQIQLNIYQWILTPNTTQKNIPPFET